MPIKQVGFSPGATILDHGDHPVTALYGESLVFDLGLLRSKICVVYDSIGLVNPTNPAASYLSKPDATWMPGVPGVPDNKKREGEQNRERHDGGSGVAAEGIGAASMESLETVRAQGETDKT